MLRAIDHHLGFKLSRFIRPHQMPIGAAIFLMAPAMQIVRFW